MKTRKIFMLALFFVLAALAGAAHAQTAPASGAASASAKPTCPKAGADGKVSDKELTDFLGSMAGNEKIKPYSKNSQIQACFDGLMKDPVAAKNLTIDQLDNFESSLVDVKADENGQKYYDAEAIKGRMLEKLLLTQKDLPLDETVLEHLDQMKDKDVRAKLAEKLAISRTDLTAAQIVALAGYQDKDYLNNKLIGASFFKNIQKFTEEDVSTLLTGLKKCTFCTSSDFHLHKQEVLNDICNAWISRNWSSIPSECAQRQPVIYNPYEEESPSSTVQ